MKITKWDGTPISKPGWYSGIPIERYHSAGICIGKAVSSSNHRTQWRHSEAKMFSEWCENPEAEPKKPSREMVLGSAGHHLLLGEDHFWRRYIKRPETYNDRKTGEVKKWHNGAGPCQDWNAKQAKAGMVPVTVDELQTVIAMSRSLAIAPVVKEGLLKGEVEISGFFLDQETGLWVKVRPDVIPTASGEYCDLKTTQEVTTVAIQKTIRNFGYHMQGALVWEACNMLGVPFDSFYLMFVETTVPYCARAVPLHDNDLNRGRMQNRYARLKIAAALATGHWPGPGEDEPLRPLPLAKDEQERIDMRLKYAGLLE
jgi:hypothetical protein